MSSQQATYLLQKGELLANEVFGKSLPGVGIELRIFRQKRVKLYQVIFFWIIDLEISHNNNISQLIPQNQLPTGKIWHEQPLAKDWIPARTRAFLPGILA